MRKTTSARSFRSTGTRSDFHRKSIEELFQQAMEHHAKGRFDRACKIYRQILDLRPDHLHSLFNLGIALHSQEELDEACERYHQALELGGSSFQGHYYLANACRDQGKWDAAVANYRKALEIDPAHCDTHYNLGLTYYHQEEPDLAIASYEEAVRLEPGHAHSLYNLGIIHFERGDYCRAISCYERSLETRPDDVDTLYNLGVTLVKSGRYEEAADRYQQAIGLAPDDAELHNSLGKVYKHQHNLEEAAACYQEAIKLRPGYGEAYTNLAIVLHILNDLDKAITCYEKAIEFDHERESAEYMLAALTGTNRQGTPRAYVRKLFDSYAERFDINLTGELGYNTPELLKNILTDIAGPGARFDMVLDLGCGTGLAGEQFRSLANRLDGVDLSGRMLDKADGKRQYDNLKRADLVEYLDDSLETYDLLVAADVLIYMGNLEEFFRGVKSRGRSGSYLLFSVERLSGSGRWQLQQSGRYAHSRSYIHELAERYNMDVEVCLESPIRKDRGEWLEGYNCCLRIR